MKSHHYAAKAVVAGIAAHLYLDTGLPIAGAATVVLVLTTLGSAILAQGDSR